MSCAMCYLLVVLYINLHKMGHHHKSVNIKCDLFLILVVKICYFVDKLMNLSQNILMVNSAVLHYSMGFNHIMGTSEKEDCLMQMKMSLNMDLCSLTNTCKWSVE